MPTVSLISNECLMHRSTAKAHLDGARVRARAGVPGSLAVLVRQRPAEPDRRRRARPFSPSPRFACAYRLRSHDRAILPNHVTRYRGTNSNTARSATRCPSRSRARWGVRSARRCCARGARRRPPRAGRWPCCVRGVPKSERARGAEKERTKVEPRAARSGAIYMEILTWGTSSELNPSSNSNRVRGTKRCLGYPDACVL